MSIAPFVSDKELVGFAKSFFHNRLETFRKDIAICLTRNDRGEHAYFPALFICIAFADLMSALYAGRLRTGGLSDFKAYVTKFMPHPEYYADQLDILYECLRHKVAHLAYPHAVFDTDGAYSATFKGRRRRLVTWTICANARRPAIELIDLPAARELQRAAPPWRVVYNSRIIVRVRRFHVDIVKSIYGRSGYLQHLASDSEARKRFANCMKGYFPPA
jgi:hypothetical protein